MTTEYVLGQCLAFISLFRPKLNWEIYQPKIILEAGFSALVCKIWAASIETKLLNVFEGDIVVRKSTNT